MLDAFQHSARVDRDAEAKKTEVKAGKTEVKAKRPPEEPPVADSPKRARRVPAQARSVPDPGKSVGAHEELLGTAPRPVRSGIPIWIPASALLLLVAMAGIYWLGDLLGDEARAGGRGDGEISAERFEDDLKGGGPAGDEAPVPPRVAPENSKLTEDDQRFLDPDRSKFTVRAIQYENDDEGWGRAEIAYLYLRDAGVPAIAPIDKGGILLICVGAEPELAGKLEQIREQLRALPGPPPQNEPGAFSGAYPVNISDWVKR
jgi:hypothetical protein